MLRLQEKGKFDLGTFCLDDALHLFGRIPDGHIAASRAWGATGRRITDVNQEVLSRTFIAQPTKVRWQCDAIERLCHGLFLPHTWKLKFSLPKAYHSRLANLNLSIRR